MSTSAPDPITTSVIEHALASVTDEMATVLISTAYSPLVRDLLDFTVALCNPRGEMVVQGLGMAIVDIKADPFEYAVDGSINYEKWMMDRAFLLLPAVDKVARYLASYKEFPPRQRPASFSIDQVVDKLNASIKSSR